MTSDVMNEIIRERGCELRNCDHRAGVGGGAGGEEGVRLRGVGRGSGLRNEERGQSGEERGQGAHVDARAEEFDEGFFLRPELGECQTGIVSRSDLLLLSGAHRAVEEMSVADARGRDNCLYINAYRRMVDGYGDSGLGM